MNSAINDTIVAVATAAGPGAISVIRLSGPNAIGIVNRVFHGKNLEEADSHTLHFGTIRKDDRVIDEVVVSVFKNPKSYTGEDVIEVSCHGSPFIRQTLLKLFIAEGARSADPGEFTLRAFLNGKLDLSQAEAVADLIASDSESSHNLAMQQMRGGFSEQINQLREELIHFASMLELELDFSEEDVEFANRDELKDLLIKIHRLVDGLLNSFDLGNVLKEGVPVVIAGKPNAGKSTLLNRLLNEDRAIVSEIEGTTRDVIEEERNINGIIFRFLDTAGIRETQDVVEAIGVKKTLEKIESAALVLYLFDVNTFDKIELNLVVNELGKISKNQGAKLILVGNKAESHELRELQAEYEGFRDIYFISAKEGDSIGELEKALVNRVLSKQTGSSDVVVSNIRHYEALQQANNSLLAAYNGLESGIPSDLIAMDVRQTLHHLGLITGEVTTDDLLGNIFSKFCIGK